MAVFFLAVIKLIIIVLWIEIESDTASKQVATSKDAVNARFSQTSQLNGDTEKAHFTFQTH